MGEAPDPLRQTDDRFSQGPVPFDVEFLVRNEMIERTIRRSWDETEKDVDVLLERVEQMQGIGKEDGLARS